MMRIFMAIMKIAGASLLRSMARQLKDNNAVGKAVYHGYLKSGEGEYLFCA